MIHSTIIIYPTLEYATQDWLWLCRKYKPSIKEIKCQPLSIKFINGNIWYFRSETEGARAYRGYRADIIGCDKLPTI